MKQTAPYLLDIVLQSLPDWTAIKKRPHLSRGGSFLLPIIQEFYSIDAALLAYRKELFIKYYLGKEDQIIDSLYCVTTGVSSTLSLVEPALKITNDLQDFSQHRDTKAYYTEGKILFAHSLAPVNGIIKWSIGEDTFSSAGALLPIWNAIDEFALIAGLRRLEKETNKQLLRRSLLSFQRPEGLGDDGLKNAVRNLLYSKGEDVQEDDIAFLSDQNLLLDVNDIDMGSAYDVLTTVNKDTYGKKQWDNSMWDHAFKTLAYIPHVWKLAAERQNGTGVKDDCKVDLASQWLNTTTTNITVSAYETSLIQMEEYCKKQGLADKIKLSLLKYKGQLKPAQTMVRVLAGQAIDITSETIEVESYKKRSGEYPVILEDIVVSSGSSVIQSRNQLTPGDKYKLRFYPKKDIGTMEISRCLVENGGVKTSLLEEKSNYHFSGTVLKNTDTKLHLETVEDVSAAINLRNNSGICPDDAGKEASFQVRLKDLGNNYIFMPVNCQEESLLTSSALSVTGFTKDASGFLACSGAGAGELKASIKACRLTIETGGGNFLLTTKVDGAALPMRTISTAETVHYQYDEAKTIEFKLTKIGNTPAQVKRVSFASYAIQSRLAKGDFVHAPAGLILPNEADNTLYVTITSQSAYAPVIQSIHIGNSLKNAMYETKAFAALSSSALNVRSNCRVELLDAISGAVLNADYKTYPIYFNGGSSTIKMEIDTSNFSAVRSSELTIETVYYGSVKKTYLLLPPAISADEIKIDGDILTLTQKDNIRSLLQMVPGDKAFVSSMVEGFVISNATTQEIRAIWREQFDETCNFFRVVGFSDTLKSEFVLDATGAKTAAKELGANFLRIQLSPANSTQFVAYNKVLTVAPVQKDITIAETFTPIPPATMQLVYVLDADGQAKVWFGTDVNKTWSLGRATFSLDISNSVKTSSMYELETKELVLPVRISKSIRIERQQDNLDLAEYEILADSKFNVDYVTDTYSETHIPGGYCTKLRFNRVKEIGLVVPLGYQLLSNGILVWTKETTPPTTIDASYVFEIPTSLTYKNLNDLYQKTGFASEAYRMKDGFPVSFENVKDGDVFFVAPSEKITAVAEHPGFDVNCLISGRIEIKKKEAADTITVQQGYFYQDHEEYYLMHNPIKQDVSRSSRIRYEECDFEGTTVHTRTKSRNYLPDSAMTTFAVEETCRMDLKQLDLVPGVSRMGRISACDNAAFWMSFQMSVNYAKGFNDIGLLFAPKKAEGYAFLNISKYITKNTSLSYVADKGLEVWIAQDQREDVLFEKSIYLRPLQKLSGGLQAGQLTGWDEKRNTYLFVRGEGKLDDILLSDSFNKEQLEGQHKKQIDKIGFAIKEVSRKETVKRLPILPDTIRFHQLDYDLDKQTLLLGSTVDWGVTKRFDLATEWENAVIKNGWFYKDHVRFVDKDGSIQTPPIQLKQPTALKSLTIKVNEAMIPGMIGFTIRVLGSDSKSKKPTEITVKKNTNELRISAKKLTQWITVQVESPAGNVINNIEVYEQYVQNSDVLRVVPFRNGYATTGIYDLTEALKWKPSKLSNCSNLDTSKVKLLVRGIRENTTAYVTTDWKECLLDKQGHVINEVLFESYRFVQFQLAILEKDTSIPVNGFEIEVL